MTKTKEATISIKHVVAESISFPVSKKYLLSLIPQEEGKSAAHCIKYEVLDSFVFELDLPWMNNKLAKAFLLKADYEHIKNCACKAKFADVKRDLTELVALIEDWRTPEAQD